MGSRLQQSHNGQTIPYALDLNAGLPQVLSDGAYTYLYGYDRIAQSGVNGMEYFLPDALGSVRQMTDGVGGVTLSQSFTPYGELLARGGIGSTAYDFAGEWTDPSGLQYLRARYYAPSTGRFISRDVWEGDTEAPMSYNAWLYGYANPVMYTDPSGNRPGGPDNIPTEKILKRYIDNGYSEKVPPPGVSFEPAILNAVGVPGILTRENFAQKLYIVEPRSFSYEGNEGGAKHTGLCGDISILWIFANYSLPENVYEMYWNHYDFLQNNFVCRIWGTDQQGELICLERDTDVDYSSNDNLARFINKYYGETFTANSGNFSDSVGAYFKVLEGLRSNGPYYLALINIDGGTGQLRNGSSNKFSLGSTTKHWVGVNGLSEGRRGLCFILEETKADPTCNGDDSPLLWVRIFNPYDNGLEYYWWGDFKSSWSKNQNNYNYVSVNKKR